MIYLFVILFFFIHCDDPDLETYNYQQLALNEELKEDRKIAQIPNKSILRKFFNRYITLVAPNKKRIFLLAQSKISNEKMLRCKNILEHFLKNYSNSIYGKDKTKVFNKMAENQAVLLLLNGSDNRRAEKLLLQLEKVGVMGQPLYEEEIQIEGGKWYTEQDYEHRDAAYEEILHLVHDYGIGVDRNDSFIGALPKFQKSIRATQEYASKNYIWLTRHSLEENKDWLEELAHENSLTQEYLASLIDSYYGLWGAFKENQNSSKRYGMWGLYISSDRAEMKREDPKGIKLIESFFHPYITYNARIDKDFKGIFYLRFDKKVSYSYHSQYLKDITLLGKNNIDIRVNELDNIITGNIGINTVIFSGESSEYSIKKNKDNFIVIDLQKNRDGKNYLTSIEKLKFKDKLLSLK